MERRVSASRRRTPQSGFTLIEILVVIVVIGVMATLSAASWHQSLGRWEINNTRRTINVAIRNTQVSAQNNKENWQFSIYETPTGQVEWASHAQKVSPTVWHAVGSHDVDIDLADTTLDKSNGWYYVRFNYKGYLASRTRTLTFTSTKSPKIKRCLVMSTLLGKIRQGEEHQQPSSSGRYCY